MIDRMEPLKTSDVYFIRNNMNESSKGENGRSIHLFDIHDKSKYVLCAGAEGS